MRRMKIIVLVCACACTLNARRVAAAEEPVLEPSQVIEIERGGPSRKPPVITAVAIVPGGGLVATAGDDHQVHIWNATDGRIVRSLKGHDDWVRALVFSPDGKTLASAGDDHRIILWKVSTGKQSVTLPAHPHASLCPGL